MPSGIAGQEQQQQQRYFKLEKIGHGSFGQVFRGVDGRTGENVAIKVVNLENDPQGIEEICKEIGVLSHCDFSNIIRYRGSYLAGSKLWIIMDYCASGSLRHLLETIGPLDEQCVLFVAREVLLALSYLHTNNIIHRDIKAANILLTEDGQVKLGDFGVASRLMLSSFRRNSFVGSPYWMAPEVIKQSQYDSKADIWSFGISVYELLMGNPPLAHIEPAKAIFMIPKSAPPRLDPKFSPAFRELVEACLHDDPAKRPSAEDLLRFKMFRGMGKSKVSPLIETLTRYRQLLKAHRVDVERTIESALPESGTIRSNWTFGTWRTDSYSNGSGEEGGDLQDEGEKLQDEDYKVQISRKEQSANGIDCQEIQFIQDDESLAKDENENLLLAICDMQIHSDPDQMIQATPLQPPSQIRSRTPTALSAQSDATSDHHRPLRSSPTLLKSRPSNDSLLFHHRKQPSLLSLSLDGGEDPLGFFDQLARHHEEERRRRLKLYDWPTPTSQANQADLFFTYKLMTELKQSLRELPTRSDPRCSPPSLLSTLTLHHQYLSKYAGLIQKATNILAKASTLEDDNIGNTSSSC